MVLVNTTKYKLYLKKEANVFSVQLRRVGEFFVKALPVALPVPKDIAGVSGEEHSVKARMVVAIKINTHAGFTHGTTKTNRMLL